MSNSSERIPIRLALNIEDKALANRLGALLAKVPGLQLVAANESADVVIILSTEISASADRDVALTPREPENPSPAPLAPEDPNPDRPKASQPSPVRSVDP